MTAGCSYFSPTSVFYGVIYYQGKRFFVLKIVLANQLRSDIKAYASPVDVLSFRKFVQDIFATGKIGRKTIATKINNEGTPNNGQIRIP
jgi:hypothetical protein